MSHYFFKDTVLHYREKSGLSQKKFADAVGVSIATIKKAELGITKFPNSVFLNSLCNYLNLSSNELIQMILYYNIWNYVNAGEVDCNNALFFSGKVNHSKSFSSYCASLMLNGWSCEDQIHIPIFNDDNSNLVEYANAVNSKYYFLLNDPVNEWMANNVFPFSSQYFAAFKRSHNPTHYLFPYHCFQEVGLIESSPYDFFFNCDNPINHFYKGPSGTTYKENEKFRQFAKHCEVAYVFSSSEERVNSLIENNILSYDNECGTKFYFVFGCAGKYEFIPLYYTKHHLSNTLRNKIEIPA